MFRVETIISRLPHHVAREHMIAFIKSKRFSMHHCQRQGRLNYEQNYSSKPEVFWAMIGHRPIVEVAHRLRLVPWNAYGARNRVVSVCLQSRQNRIPGLCSFRFLTCNALVCFFATSLACYKDPCHTEKGIDK